MSLLSPMASVAFANDAFNEQQALDFLYRYMPTPDSTDYTRDFHLENVRSALTARKEMPWGTSVPEREFNHFVLPVRVNNENLDNSRQVFYSELKDRVKGLSMAEAALEVNHWCHEKVTYQPSDARTSSPLATVRSAIGRCGEESTFTVAALRSICIPARQVYTPRWAHTDDNHAWVEVWVDGKWHFLGACEPEPILNLGWFNAPASRGMLMTTKAFGKYDGPEEQLGVNACYTEINVTDNYASTDLASVKIVDINDNPVDGARVDFRLYNCAEFYPLVTKFTGRDGMASLRAGLGDLLIWAYDGQNYGFKKLSVGKDRDVTIVLDKDKDFTGTFDFDLVPPAQSATLPRPSATEIALNDMRKAQEDSIRTAYIRTFVQAEEAEEFANSLGLDTELVIKLFEKSGGNHRTIKDFLSGISPDDYDKALQLLAGLRDKDCRDVTVDVLLDHLNTPTVSGKLYSACILNPRVGDEMLTPYKSKFRKRFSPEFVASCKENPQLWVRWCIDSISIDNEKNPQQLYMSPVSVLNHRVTDTRSRDVFFVAGARSMGIPARIDAVNGQVQYAKSASGDFIDVDFEGANDADANNPKGVLKIKYTPVGRINNPVYYNCFTISKIEDASPSLLEYPEGITLTGINATGSSLDAGKYMYVSGQRMANGSVLAHVDIFNIDADTDNTAVLTIRQDESGAQVIGSFNSENLYHDIDNDCDKSLLSTTGRGYYVLGLLSPNNEPTVHALNDISLVSDALERWGGKIMLLFVNADAAGRFDASMFKSLPSTVCYGIDNDGAISAEIKSNMELNGDVLPIFIIADTFNRVIYVSQGYTIGLGEQILDVLHKAE